MRLAALALVASLAGCAVGGEGNPPSRFAAWLAPLCVFNCVVSVTYAPGVTSLDERHDVEYRHGTSLGSSP